MSLLCGKFPIDKEETLTVKLVCFEQVTIEVVDGPETETDKDLQKESSKPSWPAPSPGWRNWWQRSSTLTRMSSGDQDYKYDSTTEDSNFLNPLGGWDGHAPSHRTFESKEQPEYGRFGFQASCGGHLGIVKTSLGGNEDGEASLRAGQAKQGFSACGFCSSALKYKSVQMHRLYCGSCIPLVSL